MNLLSLPPKLYHGTTGKLARAVFAGDKVLKPRGEAFHDRWGGVASNPAMVYLTDVYAPLYALNACVEASRNAMGDSHNERKELGIIEIDTSCLDPALFYPDEDFLARTPGVDTIVTDGMEESSCIGRERRKEKGMSNADMGEVVKTYRDSLERYQAFAGLSLESCGCACYKGEIPTEAVTRVSTLGWTTHPHIAQLIMDMSVGPEHYFFLRNQAKAVMKWLYREPVTVQQILGEDGIWEIKGMQNAQADSFGNGGLAEALQRRYEFWEGVLDTPGREVLTK